MPACGWEVTGCGCGGCADSFAPAVFARGASLAIQVMWAATGRRYGLCEVSVLPCVPVPGDALYQAFPHPQGAYDPMGGPGQPVIRAGQWFNQGCGGSCGACSAGCEVELEGPVYDVQGVSIDGAEVDPGAYRVYNHTLLTRIDGDCWPTCQRFGEQIPGFVVDYRRGTAIPPSVQGATETLACEFAKACAGGSCALPGRLKSLSREGVDIEVVPDLVTDGRDARHIRTGIAQVDLVIQSENPYGMTEDPAGTIWSPDMPTRRSRVITFQGGS